MFKISFIILFIFSISLPVLAQSMPEYVLNNEFYKNLSSSSDRFVMLFSDGFKMAIRSPYQLKESSVQPKCICKSIDLTFTGADGATETRSITIYPNKDTIDYIGKDNKTYTVNQLIDKTGKPIAGLANECEFVGKPSLLTIKNQSSCGDTRICYGTIKGCGLSEPSEASCVATSSGDCPSAKQCSDDPNVIFSSPRSILAPSQDQNQNESKSNVSNQ